MSVNANVNADEYIVTLFNRYAQQVPVTEYNRLWEQQNAGTNVFGEMHNGRLPDWAVMVMTITTWKLFNEPRNDYTYDLLSTAGMGNEDRQRQYAMSFIEWWAERFKIQKPFNRPPQRPLRTQESSG